MRHQSCSSKPKYSRRSLVGGAVSATVALSVTPGFARTTFAGGTPAATPAREDTGYAAPDSLVDPDWLNARQGEPSLVIVALMPAEDFAQGHIPGSVQVDWPALEVVDTSDASIASWRASLERTLANLGIARDSTVVVYDGGSLFAARLWWILRYLGHSDVRVLNGGLPAWRQAGNQAGSGPSVSATSGTAVYQGVPRPDVLAQMDEVMASLDDPDVVIVDARTPDEYAEGHIPGAVNLNYPLNALPEPPRFWKPPGELRAMYEAIGATPDKRIIPYCSSGVRSAVTAFTLHLIGYEDVALYTGSWQEWGPDPDAPRTEGGQP